MVGALNLALDQEMAKDNTVMIIGEDVGIDGGVFRVTDGLIQKYGEARVVDSPLAEAGIVGCSTGLAINGMKPIAEIQFSGFSYQAFAHIKQHLARFRQRSNGELHVPIVVRAPCSGGIRALEHHSESPENFFVHCQGLKVVMPSGPYDAKGLMISAIRDPDPVIFLEPKKIYRAFKEEVPEEEYTIPLGQANVVKEGSQITIVTWGAMVTLVKHAAEELEKEGVSCEIIDLRTITPLDMKTILASVEKTGRAVIVQEATPTGSFGSEIIARIQDKAILKLEAPIGKVSSFDVPYPQFGIENYFMPNVTRVKKEVKRIVNF
jgi:pyruvate dehydrogenase E1 component beta subunit